MKFEPARQYYIRVAAGELEERELPDIFINVFRRRKIVECQTLDLLKLSQKIADSHYEVIQMSDGSIQELIDNIRQDIAPLFKICDAIALLDMLAAFAYVGIAQNYVRPEMTETLAIKNGRHAIREKIHTDKFIPNDAYATQQSRFQIITGCNMSGKSTYIRSLALMAVMAQVGSFVPASYASFPIFHQLFARVSVDDNIEANVSTFSSEMRETAFILRNVNKHSMVIIDELGRGTSTRDGLCLAIAIAEALIDSRALIWFVTHFRDLAHFLAERNGVVNLHLAVEMGETNKIHMLYKIAEGCVQEKHYGITMAKVMNLPPKVIEIAEKVAQTIAQNAERRQRSSRTVAVVRRRKLILGLKEQLTQARDGNMSEEALGIWLQELQVEFVKRMAALNMEIDAIGRDDSDEEESVEMKRIKDLTRVSEDVSDIDSNGQKQNTDRDLSVQPRSVSEHEPDDFSCEMTGALQLDDSEIYDDGQGEVLGRGLSIQPRSIGEEEPFDDLGYEMTGALQLDDSDNYDDGQEEVLDRDLSVQPRSIDEKEPLDDLSYEMTGAL